MNCPNSFSTATPLVRNLISQLPLRRFFPVILLLVLGLFSVLPAARAVDPPPDGGYPGNNTAEGDAALLNNTTGDGNTATGEAALFYNASGSNNTATGVGALGGNVTGRNNTATGVGALGGNLTGNNNTAAGVGALSGYNIGHNNTAIGAFALEFSNGERNIAVGLRAGRNL